MNQPLVENLHLSWRSLLSSALSCTVLELLIKVTL